MYFFSVDLYFYSITVVIFDTTFALLSAKKGKQYDNLHKVKEGKVL